MIFLQYFEESNFGRNLIWWFWLFSPGFVCFRLDIWISRQNFFFSKVIQIYNRRWIINIFLPHSIGVELLKKYKEEYTKFEKDRQELANAEKLFDLPITMYTEMQQMEKEIKGLELIYAIYERQKVSRII